MIGVPGAELWDPSAKELDRVGNVVDVTVLLKIVDTGVGACEIPHGFEPDGTGAGVSTGGVGLEFDPALVIEFASSVLSEACANFGVELALVVVFARAGGACGWWECSFLELLKASASSPGSCKNIQFGLGHG